MYDTGTTIPEYNNINLYIVCQLTPTECRFVYATFKLPTSLGKFPLQKCFYDFSYTVYKVRYGTSRNITRVNLYIVYQV